MTAACCHSDREVFYFDEESFCHSDREAVFALTRNLVVIPTEKFFCFDEESHCHSDREKILQSLKSSFRMTVAYCHSDREVFYFDEESRCHSDREKILQSLKSSFRMTAAYCHSDREVFHFDEESHCHSDREKILQSRKVPSEWQWPIVILTLREISLPRFMMISSWMELNPIRRKIKSIEIKFSNEKPVFLHQLNWLFILLKPKISRCICK